MQHQLLQHVLSQNPSVAFPDTFLVAPPISNKFSGTYTNLTALDLDQDGKQPPSLDSNTATLSSNSTSRSPSPLIDQ